MIGEEDSAPRPSGRSSKPHPSSEEKIVSDVKNPSVLDVTLFGLGGCGMNQARSMLQHPALKDVLYFDTSATNKRNGETVRIVGAGSGSGSNRAEHAMDIERSIPQLSDQELSLGDVVIVVFGLGGGSGSVLGPLFIRNLVQRKVRVVAVAIAETSSSVCARNNLNTLKTLTAIAKKNDIYLPLVLLSNDASPNNRRPVDHAAAQVLSHLIDILTKPVYEVDRNDRLNWLDPTKVVPSAQAGLKLMSFADTTGMLNSEIILGMNSGEMVDSLLILENQDDSESLTVNIPPARLKKIGYHYSNSPELVGKVSSDITPIEKIIDYVEKMDAADRSQKHRTVSRLDSDGDSELIL